MKTNFVLLIIGTLLLCLSCTGKPQSEGWSSLLDKDLSQWEMYLSYEIKNGYKGDIPRHENGDTITPIGYNKNVKDVFTMIEEDGKPVLRVSGEIYGCVFTKESFRNYHFRLKMKWGALKWEPRLDEALDSGLLYHSQGECGVDYWRSWMKSHEFQLIENSCGDYWCIAATRVDISARVDSTLIYDMKESPISVGFGTPYYHCAIDKHHENPVGEWNEIELICYEGKSLHIVNGKVVMALSNLSQAIDGEIIPLDEGKLQLQSEAGEVFFKDVEIRPIDELPIEYTMYFKN